MRARGWSSCLALFLLWAGACVEPGAEPGKSRRDAEEDGIFHDFFDGKFDSAGHPFGALVWEGETDCSPTTGVAEAEGLAAWPGGDDAGALCTVEADALGRGRFTVNLRALTQEAAPPCAGECESDALVTVRVLNEGGQELARTEVTQDEFLDPMIYQNVDVTFSHYVQGRVTIEVIWSGSAPVRLDYVELFRSHRSLILSPPSGVLAEDSSFEIEMIDPPVGAEVQVSCDGFDLTPALDDLLASGRARRTETEFRTIITAPANELLDGCPPTTRVMVRMATNGWVRATSRVTYMPEQPACAFASTGTRVLLTGFEPFPAGSTSDNSSERAVLGFDPSLVDDITVMRLVLPVEWRSAAAIANGVIERCAPDVVVGFGQGRTAVDLETTAYNVMDASDVAGGVPDNRGEVLGGEPIAPDGPDRLYTELPAEEIVDALNAQGIAAGESDDPGRYVCNNLFYAIVTGTGDSPATGGFVHLPRIPRVNEESAHMLQAVVATTIEATLANR